MKKFELWFTSLLPVVDIVALFMAWYFAKSLRIFVDILPIDQVQVQSLGFSFFYWYFPLLVLVFAYHRLYILFETRAKAQQLFRIVSSTATTTMILFVTALFGRTLFVQSRYELWYAWSTHISLLSILYFWISSIVIITTFRWLYRALLNALLVGGVGQKTVVLIGQTTVSNKLSQALCQDLSYGYKIVGIIDTEHERCEEKEASDSTRVLGGLGDIQSLLQKYSPDNVIQADPDLPNEKVIEIISYCDEKRIDFSFAPNLFEVLAANVSISSIAGIPLLELKRTSLDGWGKIIKRAIDVALSFVFILIASPIMLITIILIKLTDGGPVFFAHERISAGKKFKLLKFRSMIVNAEKLEDNLRQTSNERDDGPLFKMKNDPRVTKLGTFLRRSRVDEIPQLFNVLVGDMSLVGPRPHTPKEIEQYKTHHRKVLAIKAGLTGIAQIAGSSDLTFDEEVRLDTFYIENWSLIKDIFIILKTPYVILFKDKSGC
jgi:exopolysaccharide biosynthesis polyprenyl glycosylphosphotransferase